MVSESQVVVFIGSQNAMPMMYALELRKRGYQVLYFVDVPRSKALSRPENHFAEISYPYPDWVIECLIPTPHLIPLFPRVFAAFYKRKLKRLIGKTIPCFVLNGFFVSMSPFLSEGARRIGLSHGSDLDTWADHDVVDRLAETYTGRSLFRYMPRPLARVLIRRTIDRQFTGFATSQIVLYFPPGFDANADKVLRRLTERGVKYVPRYDISFEPLRGRPRHFKPSADKLEIVSAVRFTFRTFPEGNLSYSKGNDLIIRGLAKYYAVNPNIRVHFFEKGADVASAKELCRDLGLERVVVWHGEMPLNQLLDLYEGADICFDQVGPHWIGAVGGYALWLGKPLIANPAAGVRSGIWPRDNPVCSATTAEEVYGWLIKLEDTGLRRSLSHASKEFVEAFMSPKPVLQQVFGLD